MNKCTHGDHPVCERCGTCGEAGKPCEVCAEDVKPEIAATWASASFADVVADIKKFYRENPFPVQACVEQSIIDARIRGEGMLIIENQLEKDRMNQHRDAPEPVPSLSDYFFAKTMLPLPMPGYYAKGGKRSAAEKHKRHLAKKSRRRNRNGGKP